MQKLRKGHQAKCRNLYILPPVMVDEGYQPSSMLKLKSSISVFCITGLIVICIFIARNPVYHFYTLHIRQPPLTPSTNTHTHTCPPHPPQVRLTLSILFLPPEALSNVRYLYRCVCICTRACVWVCDGVQSNAGIESSLKSHGREEGSKTDKHKNIKGENKPLFFLFFIFFRMGCVVKNSDSIRAVPREMNQRMGQTYNNTLLYILFELRFVHFLHIKTEVSGIFITCIMCSTELDCLTEKAQIFYPISPAVSVCVCVCVFLM